MEAAAGSSSDSSSSPHQKCVLVVDDDKNIRVLMELWITKEGFRVEMASDGEEGLAKVKAVHPDLILLDLMMPRYNGFELLRRLQEGDTAGIPVILMTARQLDLSTSNMIRQEFNVAGFFEKPVSYHALSLAMRRALKM